MAAGSMWSGALYSAPAGESSRKYWLRNPNQPEAASLIFVMIPIALPDDDVVQPQIAMTADLVNRT